MSWWITDPSRAQAERIGIADLEERNSWLRNVSWRLDSGLLLVADFEICSDQVVWPLYITYPHFFPDLPPLIKPRDPALISGHQWGPNGELCLEWRTDNWNPSTTGAQLIESSQRLLAGERAQGADRPQIPSAHSITDGQRVRGNAFRFLLEKQQLSILQSIESGALIPFSFSESSYESTFVASLTRVGVENALLLEIAPPLPSNSTYEGLALRLPIGLSFPGPATKGLLETIEKYLKIELPTPSPGCPTSVLLIDDDTAWLAMIYRIDNESRVWGYATLVQPDQESRLPAAMNALTRMRVGIVGCGSIGSKVATSLARAGLGEFLLVDDDVLLRGNLVRNDLDWRSVGGHKVTGLRGRILEVSPASKVESRRVRLGGQESSEATNSVLKALSDCNLIVDATADSTVFNLCGAAARRGQRPMIWARVYAGGIGGLVVRSRPGKDPAPIEARDQLSAWWDDRGVERPDGEPFDYGVRTGDGPPLIADDGDVSVIAAHLTRFAIDVLLSPDSSRFPYSAYAIGLAKSSIFSDPFDVYPIILTGNAGWADSPTEGALEDVVGLLKNILQDAVLRNEDTSTPRSPAPDEGRAPSGGEP